MTHYRPEHFVELFSLFLAVVEGQIFSPLVQKAVVEIIAFRKSIGQAVDELALLLFRHVYLVHGAGEVWCPLEHLQVAFFADFSAPLPDMSISYEPWSCE
jgi:hypothetical protein